MLRLLQLRFRAVPTEANRDSMLFVKQPESIRPSRPGPHMTTTFEAPFTISTMNTKPQIPATTLCAALCAALIATCSQASARTPRSRVQHGIIEMIDRGTRTLRIQREGQAVPLTLVWNSRTSFIESGRFVTAVVLTKGTPVTVWYLTPLFGKRFATKIVIERDFLSPVRPFP